MFYTGICCWYTPQLNFSAIPDGPDTDWAYWFNSVPKGAKTGKDNGFSVLFDIESYDYGYYDEGSEGLKVAIVHHLDMPIIRQRAFHVAPGTENQIPVTPTLYTTNQQVSKIWYAWIVLRKIDCFISFVGRKLSLSRLELSLLDFKPLKSPLRYF